MPAKNLVPFVLVAICFAAVSPVSAEDTPLLNRIFGKASSSSKSQSAPKGKRVEINLTDQKLRAYEGKRLVMQTKISSGKNRGTPTGNFRAGPYKNEMHYSSLYENAPMPWSTQVSGHIFIHGYSIVPSYPASHGCIRVPISGRNPAKRLYKWLDVGTPIRIAY
ncbi:MAG: L,D-transpeptidase [Verrucomicrobiales bacterium]